MDSINPHFKRSMTALSAPLSGQSLSIPTSSPVFRVLPSLTLSITMQAFSALRTPVARRVAFSASRAPRAPFRSSYRRFSTEPQAPKPKSNAALYATGLGAIAVGGIAFYLYSGSSDTLGTSVKSGVQSAKAGTKLVPTREDYQKVR